MIRCRLEVEKRGGHLEKEYADMYGKMMEVATRQIIGNIEEFVKHWAWDEVSVERVEQGSGRKREEVMGMERVATKV